MPTPANRVKHFLFGPYKDEPIATILSTRIKGKPYSWTDRESQANNIALSGNYIYVVEVDLIGGFREYKLGYYFKANTVVPITGGKMNFKIQSSSVPDGMYLNTPIKLTGLADAWVRKPSQGMPSIPDDVVSEFDVIFSSSGKPF